MIYDTDLNITRLQDANYAKTRGVSAIGLVVVLAYFEIGS